MVRAFARFSILGTAATFGIIAGLVAALFIGNILAANGIASGERAAAQTIIIEQ